VNKELQYNQLGYNKEKTCTSGKIVIYSKTGNQVTQMNINNTSGIQGIDMSQMAPASYIIKITDCYGFTKELKFVKQ